VVWAVVCEGGAAGVVVFGNYGGPYLPDLPLCFSVMLPLVLLATNSQKLKIKLLRISFYFNVAISSLLSSLSLPFPI